MNDTDIKIMLAIQRDLNTKLLLRSQHCICSSRTGEVGTEQSKDSCMYLCGYSPEKPAGSAFSNCTSSVYKTCKKSSLGNLPDNVTAAISKRCSFWSGSDAFNLFYFFIQQLQVTAVPSFSPGSSLTLKYIELFSLLLFSIRFRGDSSVWK